MDNIIFIGMPAVGKSTVGVVTAKRLGYQFIDTDLLIQEQEPQARRRRQRRQRPTSPNHRPMTTLPCPG